MKYRINICIVFALYFSSKSWAQSSAASNFSVRYNFLYNANELLDEYERDMIPTPQEDYEHILPVFISHADKPDQMNKVITKARTIITEKGNSSYVGLAHLLMARASLNKGDYITAISYSDDVLHDYGNDREITGGALIIKAKALFAIHDLENGCLLAVQIGDQAAMIMGQRVEAYTVAAQGAIYKGNWQQAINHLSRAIKYSHNAEEKSRMHYVTAQLLEKIHQPLLAVEQYKKAKSTSGFEELKLNAVIRELELNPSEQEFDKGVPVVLKRLLKQKPYQDYQDQLYYTIAKYEQRAGDFDAAVAHYLQAAQLNGRNALLLSNAYARAADLQLRIGREYSKAHENYRKAITALPKSDVTYSQKRYKLKYSNEITERYLDLAKVDTIQNEVERPPYNKKVIAAYYDIATMYFQDLQDSTAAEKVYTSIQRRFPASELSSSVEYALQLLGNKPAASRNLVFAGANDFLNKRAKRQFTDAVNEAALLNRYRNRSLEKSLQFYDENMVAEQKPPEEVSPTLAVITPQRTNFAGVASGIKTADTLIHGLTPVPGIKTQFPEVIFNKETEIGSYYFMVAIEDGGLNMSPSRFGIGEFNRSRYADSNLRHRLLEFEKTQVIYVGVFASLTDAKNYANDINPQLKSIMKTNGAKYTSSIISKENLEKLESDEIYKVYEDFNKP